MFCFRQFWCLFTLFVLRLDLVCRSFLCLAVGLFLWPRPRPRAFRGSRSGSAVSFFLNCLLNYITPFHFPFNLPSLFSCFPCLASCLLLSLRTPRSPAFLSCPFGRRPALPCAVLLSSRRSILPSKFSDNWVPTCFLSFYVLLCVCRPSFLSLASASALVQRLSQPCPRWHSSNFPIACSFFPMFLPTSLQVLFCFLFVLYFLQVSLQVPSLPRALPQAP